MSVSGGELPTSEPPKFAEYQEASAGAAFVPEGELTDQLPTDVPDIRIPRQPKATDNIDTGAPTTIEAVVDDEAIPVSLSQTVDNRPMSKPASEAAPVGDSAVEASVCPVAKPARPTPVALPAISEQAVIRPEDNQAPSKPEAKPSGVASPAATPDKKPEKVEEDRADKAEASEVGTRAAPRIRAYDRPERPPREKPVSETRGDQIRLARPTPDAWKDLISTTEEVLREDVPRERQSRAAEEAWDAVLELDKDERARNRYFGYGKITCAVAQGTSTPKQQESFINDGTHRLLDHHRFITVNKEDRARGLPLLQVFSDGDGLVKGSEGIMSHYKDIPTAEIIVINTLHLLKNRDRPFQRLPKGIITNHGMREILMEDRALMRVVNGGLAFAANIVQRALQRHFEQNYGLPTSQEIPEHVLVRDALTSKEIRLIDPTKVAAILASLRLDEARNAVPYIELDPYGQPTIDRDILPKKPSPEIPPVDRWHIPTSMAERQGCPALYVAPSIPFAGKAITEIVSRVQDSYGH